MANQVLLAKTVLGALIPSWFSEGESLDNAIRVELLVIALHDIESPRTLGELLRVLERISVGEVAEELLMVTRKRAQREPDQLLRELSG